MVESLKPPYLQRDETRGDYQVWIVDGAPKAGHDFERSKKVKAKRNKDIKQLQ
jgi:hypothetical protein